MWRDVNMYKYKSMFMHGGLGVGTYVYASATAVLTLYG